MAQQGVIVRKKEDVQYETLKTVQDVMDTISHGSLTLLIQDGRVLQIDKKEKIRLK
ncbi:MAG: YezD family protein [Geobacter sp.]|nr:YezD family protein [Geobacter sp.]